MNPEFTIEELKKIHLALISRERLLVERWIPIERDSDKKESMMQEAVGLGILAKKVCAAQLSKELGFEIPPLGA